MSKDFDTTLSDAIDLAAGAAQTAGASAARLRGRKRTMRKRIALSTMSLVLIAAAATVAFKASGPANGGAANVTTASPNPTVSPSSIVRSSPTTGPTAPATTSSPPTGTSPAAVVADPHQVAGAAWLSPGQVPFAATFHWKAVQADPQGSSPIGQQLTSTVFYVAKDTVFQALTTCGDPAQLLAHTIGAQHAQYATPAKGAGSAANQYIFFFADAASAQQTFAWLQGQYGPSCMPGFGLSITKTAGDGVTSASWLTVKHSAGPVDLSPYNREYFVLRGSTIAWVSVDSVASSVASPYDDAAQLSALAAHLCVYGGPCH